MTALQDGEHPGRKTLAAQPLSMYPHLGSPSSSPVLVWNTGDVLPCMTPLGARTTSPVCGRSGPKRGGGRHKGWGGDSASASAYRYGGLQHMQHAGRQVLRQPRLHLISPKLGYQNN